MTIEQKAEAYDACCKQRDAYGYLLANLIDRIHSGCNNNWDLDRAKEIKDRVTGPCQTWKEWQKSLHDNNLFHLWRIVSCMIDTEEALDEIKRTPQEIQDLIKKWDLKAISERIECKEKLYDSQMGWSLKKIAAYLLILLNECPIGNGLPGDEQSIYGESFGCVLKALCEHINVDLNNKEQVLDLLHEYDPDIKLEEKE